MLFRQPRKCRYAIPAHTIPLQALLPSTVSFSQNSKGQSNLALGVVTMTHFLLIFLVISFCVHVVATLWLLFFVRHDFGFLDWPILNNPGSHTGL